MGRPTVHVVWVPKQRQILGVYTTERKAAPVVERHRRDGIPATVDEWELNPDEDGNEPQDESGTVSGGV